MYCWVVPPSHISAEKAVFLGLSRSYTSCWACQEYMVVTALYPGRFLPTFSQANMRDEVISSWYIEATCLLLAIKVIGFQCYSAVSANLTILEHPSGLSHAAPRELEGKEWNRHTAFLAASCDVNNEVLRLECRSLCLLPACIKQSRANILAYK